MEREIRDCFAALELDEGATFAQVKEQYRFLVQCFHPDKHQGEKNKKLANRRMQEINVAFARLEGYFASTSQQSRSASSDSPDTRRTGSRDARRRDQDAGSRGQRAAHPEVNAADFPSEIPVESEEAKTRIKGVISDWSNRIEHHDLKNLGAMVDIRSIIEKPAYAVTSRTQEETRTANKETKPTEEDLTPRPRVHLGR